MSHPLPTHEVVAVFPAEIKAGVVRLPVGTVGKMVVLFGTREVMAGVRDTLTAALASPPINPATGRPARYNKSPAATQPVAS